MESILSKLLATKFAIRVASSMALEPLRVRLERVFKGRCGSGDVGSDSVSVAHGMLDDLMSGCIALGEWTATLSVLQHGVRC